MDLLSNTFKAVLLNGGLHQGRRIAHASLLGAVVLALQIPGDGIAAGQQRV
jgi:hypothetical protein